MFIFTIFTITLSFVIIWFSAGYLIETANKAAKKAGISSFIYSFFVLGSLTSSTEIAVSINSLADKVPAISVGNLIGGVNLLFLVIIPIFCLLNGRLLMKTVLNSKLLFLLLAFVGLGGLFLSDGKLRVYEGFVIIIAYFGILSQTEEFPSNPAVLKASAYKYINFFTQNFVLVKMLGTTLLIIIFANYLVESFVYLSEQFGISRFILSYLFLTLGTNMPEIMIGLRAIYKGAGDVALGNYLGSAVTNILLLGVVIVISDGIDIKSGYVMISIITVLTVILFYVFSYSERSLNKKESIFLILLYLFSLAFEIGL